MNWIDVKQRLPTTYPVFGVNVKHKFQAFVLGYDDKNKMGGHCFHVATPPFPISVPITHWMPLPEPPECT